MKKITFTRILLITSICYSLITFNLNAVPVNFRGVFNGWGCSSLNDRVTVMEYRFQENTTSSGRNFKFDSDCNWGSNWGAGSTITKNSKFSIYSNGSDGFYASTSGNFYTFIVQKISNGSNGNASVLETNYNPRTFNSVTRDITTPTSSQTVTVSATLNNVLQTGEYCYLRYTTNGWSTSTIVAMNTGTNPYTATIPAQLSNTTVSFYCFTSNQSTIITSSDADYFTLELLNNANSNYSYTVIAPTASTDYFRSNSTGNWSDIASWQSSANNSTWINSSLVPGSSATAITILNGHDITLDVNTTISNLTINSGGTFTASDATARTLTISKSTSGSSATLTNNGTWANGSGGSTVIFSGAPSSGDAIHTITGTIGFQNITVNKTSGTSNIGASFNTGSTISGTLEIGSGGFISTAPPTSFYGSNAILKFNQGAGATYNVNTGDYSWSTTEIPQNITISSGTVNLNANRTASGNLVIDGGSLVLKNANSTNLTIQGNWTRSSGTFTANDGTVTLSGTADGIVTVTGGATMNNLVVSKTGGAKATLNCNLSTSALTIDAGAILTVSAAQQLSVNTTFTNNGTLNLKSDNSGAVATILTPATITGSGTYNIEQYLTAGRNWYISSPISGATSNVFSASVSYPMYAYNEPQGTNAPWTTISNTSTTLTDAKGYIAKIQADGNVTFIGTTLNNGSKSIALTRTTGQTKEGFNLVGNPYPSHLAWTEATATAANVLPTIWYRTAAYNSGASKYDYSFVTYNAPSGVTIPDVGSGGYIPPMQAFWVRANTAAGGTLSFSNALRYHQASNPLKAPAKQNTSQKILRLQVSNGTESDEAVVYFDTNASNDFDDYDSPKMQNDASIPDIYTLSGNEKLAINGLNSIPLDQEIPIGFRTDALHDFTLKSTELSNFDPNLKVILKDNGVENDITDGTAYNFSSEAATTSSRFSLIFRSAGATTDLSDKQLNKDFVVFKNTENKITVIVKEQTNKSYNIAVYNSTGQKLEEVLTIKSETILNKTLCSGVYFVAINANGKSVTHKLVVY